MLVCIRLFIFFFTLLSNFSLLCHLIILLVPRYTEVILFYFSLHIPYMLNIFKGGKEHKCCNTLVLFDGPEIETDKLEATGLEPPFIKLPSTTMPDTNQTKAESTTTSNAALCMVLNPNFFTSNYKNQNRMHTPMKAALLIERKNDGVADNIKKNYHVLKKKKKKKRMNLVLCMIKYIRAAESCIIGFSESGRDNAKGRQTERRGRRKNRGSSCAGRVQKNQ
jgi:hypothetical protein